MFREIKEERKEDNLLFLFFFAKNTFTLMKLYC